VSPLSKEETGSGPVPRRLRHDAGRLGLETKGQSIPSRPFTRLDQGQEPEVAGNEPGEECYARSVLVSSEDLLNIAMAMKPA
jgi:hypothetical protein